MSSFLASLKVCRNAVLASIDEVNRPELLRYSDGQLLAGCCLSRRAATDPKLTVAIGVNRP